MSAFSCRDVTLQSLALPLYAKTPNMTCPTSALPVRAFSSLGPDRILPPLPPLTDLPLLSTLQGKKPSHCRDASVTGSAPYLVPYPNPLNSQGSSLFPHLSDAVGPYCLYRYSFPLSPPLSSISRQNKLAADSADSVLRQSPWHPTTNHCL